MKEAAEFAESTQILMNVSEFTDVSQATDTLISAVQAFGYTAETSMNVVDLLNTIGNNYAISTADLAQSLTKSSASLVAAGGDLAEAAALTATANAIIQDADSVGTALKTTSLRLRGTDVKVLEEEGLDSEGAVTSKSKLQSKVKALSGVDILTATGEYKSTYEILSDIAEVWGSINDMDQAALLELISGKRNSSVIAAILQNPEDLKAAYEDAMDAEGSALKENEKYLDSIQGKIDQFTNATQSMWNNFLNADTVKFFVELATQLVKIVDAVGPLNVALVGLFAYLGKQHGLFDNIFKPAAENIDSLQNQLKTAKKDLDQANKKYQKSGSASDLAEREAQAQRVQEISRQIDETTSSTASNLDGVTESIAAQTVAQNANNTATSAGIAADRAAATATDVKTTSIWAAITAEAASGTATKGSVLLAAQQALANKLAGTSFVQKGLNAMVASGAITAEAAASAASLPIHTLLAAGIQGVNIKLAEMWALLWPIGLIVLAVTAAIAALALVIYGIVKGVDAFIVTAKELEEELSGLKEEISGVKEEISSLNGELETTQERMAELLSKDSLTFTEQEELDNLQKQNDLLEREIYLLEQKEKRLQDQAQRTFDDLMKKNLANTKRDLDDDGEKDDVFDRSLERRIEQYKNRIEKYEQAQTELVKAERELEEARNGGDESAIKKAEKKVERKEKKAARKAKRRDKKKGQIDEELTQYIEYAEGIDYESADSTTREYLDYIDNTVGKLAILEGDAQAKSMEIKRIFNKDSLSDASDEIDRLVEQLKQKPGDTNIIAQISEQCKLAEGDLKAVGLEVQDAFDYFTMSGSSSSDYIMKQYGAAVKALNDLKAGTINLSDFVVYDSKTGKADADILAIAEKLKGVSSEVQQQFAAIVEDIKEGSYKTEDGLTNWDAAIKKLELQGMQAVIATVRTELESANKLAFPDLEISGWIDTVEELRSAFESLSSAMDLIVTAHEQMNSSGRISMKTALDLMATTDDWNQILDVNNGVITMNANAEQILIQSKLDLIKANIEMALQQVETDIALMEGAINSTKAGNAFTQGFTKALTNAQGVLVGLKAGWDAFWAGGDVSAAFNNAYSNTVDNLTPDESSLGDLYTQRANLLKQKEMLTGIDTTKEFKDNYDFDKKPGDKYGDSEDDAFQREMDYWENRIAANQAKYEQLQNEIDLMEKKGQKADASFYEEQIQLENERKWLLEQQRGEAKKYLDQIVAAGNEGSEEFWDVANTLNDIEGELDDVTASVVDLQDAIGEIDTYKFEEFTTRLDNLTSKLGTIRDLIAPNSEEDWFDDEGNWTDAGIAVAGTYLQELETYKQGYQETMDELAKYESPYAGNEEYYEALGIHSEQEYYDKVEALTDQQYQFAESISDTEQEIVGMYESSIDAVEEYVDTLIDGYNDYIDSVKEALDAERDLYDFKKNVQKQAKDISEIERRIASLSGSTNKADIAERRKLEAQLYESRESLNDTYYDHAKDSQNEALDAEASAYEETMTRMVEGMCTSLQEATADMDAFLESVTIAVSMNADTVLEKYRETEVPLNDAITNPWEEAKTKVGQYAGEANNLMDVWKQGGYFAEFKSTASTNLSSPWSSGTDAANAFKNSVNTVMDDVVAKIDTNIQEASGKLSNLYQQIIDTEKRAKTANVNVGDLNAGNTDNTVEDIKPTTPTAPKKDSTTVSTAKKPSFKQAGWADGIGLDIGSVKYNGTEFANNSVIGSDGKRYLKWRNKTTSSGQQLYVKEGEGFTRTIKNGKYVIDFHTGASTYTKYAKGTIGTKEDQLAITDEPQFGDELVLVPGKDGNLSFMRKGTGVVPADLTANLMEWGQFTPDSMNLGSGINVNMINNAVNKPEFNFAFDALVKAENITEETLPAVKKLVTQELNRFTKELNYALKGKGAR